MKSYLCFECNHRWEEEQAKKCPKCGEIYEIRETMSRREAEEKGYEPTK